MSNDRNENAKSDKYKCICCSIETTHICASSIAPFSDAYCEECQKNNAEPWFIVKNIGEKNNWILTNRFLDEITIFENGEYKKVRTKIAEMGLNIEIKSDDRIDIDKLKTIFKRIASENPENETIRNFLSEDIESISNLSFRYFFHILEIIVSDKYLNGINSAYSIAGEVLKKARNTNDILRIYKLFFIRNKSFSNKEFHFELIKKADELANNFNDHILISNYLRKNKLVSRSLAEKFFEKGMKQFMKIDENDSDRKSGFCMLKSMIDRIAKNNSLNCRNMIFEIVRKAEKIANCVKDYLDLYEIVADPKGKIRDYVIGCRLLKKAEEIATNGDDFIDIACELVDSNYFYQDKKWAASLFRKGLKSQNTFQCYTLEQITEIIDFHLEDDKLKREIEKIIQSEIII